ncbi:MAG TPA: phosphoribosyl-AMP cyclohydrolase [Candidatus Dormibacteraeota bacterium]|nr:phosphoribosyl-AMP cyclohydrolase [Candidatus Dormibacteraeota bacterium]
MTGVGRGDPGTPGDGSRTAEPAPDFSPDFSRGPIPAVVQDAGDGEVLMLAYVDAESWRRTLETGHVWFRSRSRGLWEKGATSGSYLDLVEARLDCDRDALLLRVRPRGPVCHTGARGCFEVGGTIRAG